MNLISSFSHLNAFALSGILIFITDASFAVYVFSKGFRSRATKLWCLEALSVALFGFGIFFVATALTPDSARFWWRITHLGVILIPTVYYAFTYVFLELEKKTEAVFCYALAGFFLVLNLTPYFIDSMRFVFNSFYYDSPPSGIYVLFVVFFVYLLGLSHYRLWLASRNKKIEQSKRMQAKYFMLATLTGLVGGLTAFLPVFGLDVYPYANFMVAIYPMIMAYAILRYRLFNVRAVLTEILVALLWFFLITRIFLEKNLNDRIVDTTIFALVFALGIFLIRSVREEIRQKERQEALAMQLQDLTSHLREKVIQQTKELMERNERLEALAKQKDEFLTLIAHRLRTPLTAIKWIGLLFTKGSLGKISKEQEVHVVKLNDVTENLIELVDDILNVIRIEEGRFGFSFQQINLSEVLHSVIGQNKIIAENKGVKMEDNIDNVVPLSLDEEKITIAFENIINNAVKYTPTGGTVKIFLKTDNKKVTVEISDTGIGVPEKDSPRIFEKFFRSRNAFRVETEGTGLGLYIARNIILAHNGDISFSSEEGKGTTFVITLPIVVKTKKV